MRAFLVLATIAALVPACRKKAPPLTVGLALDVGGRGDQSFNDGTLRGLENMAAGLRYTPRGYEPLPDVRAVVCRENEGTFLAGAVAGEITRSGKIGFVGGMQLPLIQKFEAGFRAGVAVVNPEAARNVLVAYTGTFDDERKGVEVGLDLYRRGCDVVFHSAGLDGLGVIKAAQLSGKIVIGVDSDQSPVAPAKVLTRLVKHADVVVYDGVRDVVQGKFTGGDVALGLAEGAMGLVPLSPATFPTLRAMGVRDPEELTAIVIDVQTLQHAVMTRRVSVPATLEELKAFHPPDPAATGKLRAAKR